MHIKLFRLLFSFSGRISRSAFWWTVVLLGLAFIVLFVFLSEELGRASTLALYPPFFWVLAASAAKRMRDRGKSPAWFFVVLVPVLGPLWLFIDTSWVWLPTATVNAPLVTDALIATSPLSVNLMALPTRLSST